MNNTSITVYNENMSSFNILKELNHEETQKTKCNSSDDMDLDSSDNESMKIEKRKKFVSKWDVALRDPTNYSVFYQKPSSYEDLLIKNYSNDNCLYYKHNYMDYNRLYHNKLFIENNQQNNITSCYRPNCNNISVVNCVDYLNPPIEPVLVLNMASNIRYLDCEKLSDVAVVTSESFPDSPLDNKVIPVTKEETKEVKTTNIIENIKENEQEEKALTNYITTTCDTSEEKVNKSIKKKENRFSRDLCFLYEHLIDSGASKLLLDDSGRKRRRCFIQSSKNLQTNSQKQVKKKVLKPNIKGKNVKKPNGCSNDFLNPGKYTLMKNTVSFEIKCKSKLNLSNIIFDIDPFEFSNILENRFIEVLNLLKT